MTEFAASPEVTESFPNADVFYGILASTEGLLSKATEANKKLMRQKTAEHDIVIEAAKEALQRAQDAYGQAIGNATNDLREAQETYEKADGNIRKARNDGSKVLGLKYEELFSEKQDLEKPMAGKITAMQAAEEEYEQGMVEQGVKADEYSNAIQSSEDNDAAHELERQLFNILTGIDSDEELSEEIKALIAERKIDISNPTEENINQIQSNITVLAGKQHALEIDVNRLEKELAAHIQLQARRLSRKNKLQDEIDELQAVIDKKADVMKQILAGAEEIKSWAEGLFPETTTTESSDNTDTEKGPNDTTVIDITPDAQRSTAAQEPRQTARRTAATGAGAILHGLFGPLYQDIVDKDKEMEGAVR